MIDNEIDILSQLSQIEISQTERDSLSASIDQMLEYFSLMGEFTDEQQPRETPIDNQDLESQLVCNAEEREVVGNDTHDYTDIAPEEESGFFVVPHVI